MINILFFQDAIGTFTGATAEEEALEVKQWLKDFIFGKKKFEYKSTFDSCDPGDKQYDILIFDFGGIGIGCTDLAYSLSREILRLIEEKPNTLFIAWTSFTNEYLQGECEKELGEYPNLYCRDLNDKELAEKIKEWIKVTM
jgi:hypothetical protein